MTGHKKGENIMKFTTPKLTLDLLESVDVIASSLEDVTNPGGEQPTTNGDPYEDDKW